MGPTRETDDGHIDYRYITYKHHDINIYKQKQETRGIMLFTDPTSCTDSLPSELKDRKLNKKKTPVVKHGNVKSKETPPYIYTYIYIHIIYNIDLHMIFPFDPFTWESIASISITH